MNILSDERNFGDGINLRTLRWGDYLQLCRWNCIIQIVLEEGSSKVRVLMMEMEVREGEIYRYYTGGFEVLGRGHKPKA